MPRPQRLLYILAIIQVVLPFILQHPFYQPHRDEFLYLAEARHLDWGYMEVPPLLSVFAWLSKLFGEGMFWIKIWPAVFGSLTFLLVGKLILSLGGKGFALLLGWFPFVLDGYIRLFFLFQPNFLDVFFWTLMAFCLVKYVQSKEVKWIYWFAIAAGLGIMSKYSVSFFAFSLLLGLAISSQRSIYASRHLYFGGIIALLIILPNIAWQYNHRFPVVNHMEELQEEQLRFINSLDFIINQLVMNLPCVFTWIAGWSFIMFGKAGKPYRFIGWAYAIVIAILLILHGKAYYALGAYPVLFAFGAYFIEKLTAARMQWLRYAVVGFALLLGIFALPLALPVAPPEALISYYQKTGLNKTGDFKWEDLQQHPLPQDYADMMGWKEMAEKAAAIYKSLPPAEQERTGIYCRGYFSAGALNYYGPSLGLPEVFSDDASFLLWMPVKYNISNLLLVGHRVPGKDDVVFQQFEKMTIVDSVNMPLFRENGMKFILFENGNDSLNTIIERGVARLKSKFQR